MFRHRFTWIAIAVVSVISIVGPRAVAQGFVDNFNLADQATPPAGWSVFRGEWTITDGTLTGESSNFDNNPMREAWIWAGQPALEFPADLDLSFDMNFLTDSNVGDRNGRHAGVMFCSSRSTFRWDRADGITGYCLDWTDNSGTRGVRLIRIDRGNQTVLRNAGRELAGPPLRWRVTADSEMIRVWGDGALIMEVADSRYRGGHFGFWVWSNGTRVAYDNVMSGDVALLPLAEERSVRLQPGVDGEDTEAFYFTAHREAGAPGNVIIFSLDGQEGDENALLMAWGRVPTRNDYDLVADAHGQADQRLVIPFARDDYAYIVPYAKSDAPGGNGFNSVTLQATLPGGISLEGLSVQSAFKPSRGGAPIRVTTSIFGTGFTEETSFFFSGRVPMRIEIVETQFVSSSHVLLTLEITDETLPALYSIRATNGGPIPGWGVLRDAFLLEEREDGVDPGELEVSLVAAGEVRPYRVRPLQVRYRNSGGTSLAPRLLRIHPPEGVQLRLANDYAFSPPDVPIDILTVNSVGYPGSLPPGASGVQNLVYVVNFVPDQEVEGADQLDFTVEELSAEDGDLLCLEAGPDCAPGMLTKPDAMPQEAWARMGNVLGNSLSGFIDSLGGLSTRLAIRGGNPASVSEALRLAAHTAWSLEEPGSHFSAAFSGVLRDSFGNPLGDVRVAAVRGIERVCSVTRPSGFFVLEGLQGGAVAYQFEVEGFSASSEGVVAVGGETSLGSVVVGAVNDAAFECELVEDTLLVAPLATSADRLLATASVPVQIIIPIDPNYKSGTAGQSTEKQVDLGEIVPEGKDLGSAQANVWIPYADDGEVQTEFDGRTIVYEITFENDADAQAPAQKVDVFDCLPPELDWSTVRFLGAGVDADFDCTDANATNNGFQNSEEICIPPSGQGVAGFARFDIDLSADDGFLPEEQVDVKILCSQEGNLLIWNFTSLQGGTEAEVVDDEQGFLVPYDEVTHEGEAWVQFSVELKDEKDVLAPGTLIRNDATVVFKDLELPDPEPGQVVPVDENEWEGLDCEEDGGAAGFGGEDGPGYVLTTAPVYHIIPQENYFFEGCDNGIDDDMDGLMDCDDDDCDTDEFCVIVEPVVTFRRGDADGNGILQLTDGIRILSTLFLGQDLPSCLDAADTDDSGALQLTDGIIIFQFLFLGGAVPANPGPFGCGSDPTDDTIDCEVYEGC